MANRSRHLELGTPWLQEGFRVQKCKTLRTPPSTNREHVFPVHKRAAHQTLADMHPPLRQLQQALSGAALP